MRSVTPVILSCLLLGACSSTSSSPNPSPYVSGNYSGTLKIGNPYNIEGKTYTPAYDPAYEEVGMASWYGPGFHGRSTANGERFDQHGLTAAHRTLPMPSMVRVTNLENGKNVVVKVNDRGPFAKNRIIDLSKGAAEKLGVIRKGTAQVRVEYLREETRQLIAGLLETNQIKADEKTLAMLDVKNIQPRSAAQEPAYGWSMVGSAHAATPSSTDYAVADYASLTPVSSQDIPPPQASKGKVDYVAALKEPVVAVQKTAYTSKEKVGVFIQAGSFSDAGNAHALSRKISSVGPSVVKSVDVNGQTWYRVRLGPLQDMGTAHAALADLQGLGVTNATLITD